MGLAAVSKGSVSCRAGQCARCALRPTTALPRGARRCPLPWLSLGGPATLPYFSTGCCTDSQGWHGPFSMLLPSPSSSQVSCRGGKNSELSHPSQHWVLTLEPRYENEKLMALRGLAGWAPLPCPPGGCQGRARTRGVSRGWSHTRPHLQRCRARWSELMFILIMSSQCIRKLIKSTHYGGMFHSELCRCWEELSPTGSARHPALAGRERMWVPSSPPHLPFPRWQGGQRGCAGHGAAGALPPGESRSLGFSP